MLAHVPAAAARVVGLREHVEEDVLRRHPQADHQRLLAVVGEEPVLARARAACDIAICSFSWPRVEAWNETLPARTKTLSRSSIVVDREHLVEQVEVDRLRRARGRGARRPSTTKRSSCVTSTISFGTRIAVILAHVPGSFNRGRRGRIHRVKFSRCRRRTPRGRGFMGELAGKPIVLVAMGGHAFMQKGETRNDRGARAQRRRDRAASDDAGREGLPPRHHARQRPAGRARSCCSRNARRTRRPRCRSTCWSR